MLHIQVGPNSVQKVHNILSISPFCLLSSFWKWWETMQTMAHLPHSDLCDLISDSHFMFDLFAKSRREICFVKWMMITIFKMQFLHSSLKKNNFNFNSKKQPACVKCLSFKCNYRTKPVKSSDVLSKIQRCNFGSAGGNRELWIIMNVGTLWYNINYTVQTFTIQ